MNLGIAAATFGLIFVAEFPDKTMIASIVMGSRGKPLAVWTGASVAFMFHVALAVTAGRFLQLLPHRVLEGVITGLFLVGAAYLLLIKEKEEVDEGIEEAQRQLRFHRVALGAFAVIFVGEFGDLTQILTLNLEAKYHSIASVATGAALGLITVAAVGAFGGKALTQLVPLSVVRRLGGLIVLGLGIFNLVNLVTT